MTHLPIDHCLCCGGTWGAYTPYEDQHYCRGVRVFRVTPGTADRRLSAQELGTLQGQRAFFHTLEEARRRG